MKPIWMWVSQLDFEGLEERHKAWVTQAVAGALVADGVVAEAEKPHLAALLEMIEPFPALKQLAWDIIWAKKSARLEKIDLDPQTAVKVYKIVLEIAAADLSLHPHEIRFLLDLSEKLSLPKAQARQLLKSTLQVMRIDYLLTMKSMLGPTEREWLATAIVQLVWADGVVEARETLFLSHLFDLISDEPELMKQLREAPQSLDLEKLGSPHFGTEFAETILRYLTEMTLSDERLEPFGLDVARVAGKRMGITPERAEELILETGKILGF
ncbi:MAG: hypothetical protein A2600_11610 [Candidatus Lambdaproteobacteria bacterium RIFOXYD1_FULL_56_27]|uniref:Co-chaperone DjlA N-terminal domain-containing protein n=1 Tax=Candidatus Lambdaproteobacteria bacterium RIFOXYD2_FULL_56_26 TaxID=1817773 RepID=A0A1F6GYX2_9PROT|nr:MAG: hypothetical protein A2426_06240 [Candidatus Lambdaproteobacteria bacterium RIFOXYC1_FULL_56_13]OGH03244.1 MAG: hypothetical protein A2557_00785 [Candidatus Lambdaproteobacteria bacterium RIFOXYD2_FULL_56_26]OGH08181.1 MAG: hypothetical protein A2600_11610 [Candidatus Lambdaproteobacteria bacterium RIFOXYD1_FULL_56_27]